jgi:hypothetical protein
MAEPRPVSEIEADAEKTFRLSRRFIYSLMLGMGALVVVLAIIVGLLVDNSIGERQRTQDQILSIATSQCSLDFSVATSPVTSKTTKLGFNLVEGARIGVEGLHCPQKLPPPSSILLQLGQKFGSPVS